MIISVRLHTILQRETPHGMQRKLTLQLADGSSIGDVLRELEIQLPVDALLLVVNGRLCQPATILNNDDELDLIPALSGGAHDLEIYSPTNESSSYGGFDK